jgi:hypothetical protein
MGGGCRRWRRATMHRQGRPGSRLRAGPALGDKRVSNRRPDACFHGAMPHQSHACFAALATTDAARPRACASAQIQACATSARHACFCSRARPACATATPRFRSRGRGRRHDRIRVSRPQRPGHRFGDDAAARGADALEVVGGRAITVRGVSNRFADWIAAYETAWRTEGTAPVGRLFTEDATYQAAPFDEALAGVGAIARFWEHEREGPDEVFTLISEIVAAEGILRWPASRSCTEIRRSAPIAICGSSRCPATAGVATLRSGLSTPARRAPRSSSRLSRLVCERSSTATLPLPRTTGSLEDFRRRERDSRFG